MSQQTEKILLADDEPHVIYVVRYKLEKAGHEILTATNGKDAFDIACAEQPAIVISDFQMPGGSGLEMALRLHANPTTAHIPVILLTARAHKVKPSELAQTNIRHLMDKPFSPTELIDKVNDVLSESEGDNVEGCAA